MTLQVVELKNPSGPKWRGKAQTVVIWLGILAFVSLVGIVNQPSDGIEAFDPDSTRPDGAKALSLLMEKVGATVSRGPAPQGQSALLMHDDLDDQQRQIVSSWTDAGGILVVADPSSPFSAGATKTSSLTLPETLVPECDSSFVGGVDRIEPSSKRSYSMLSGGGRFDTKCFKEGGSSFMLVRSQGFGTVISLGGASIFTNEQLDEESNAVLAVDLLASFPEKNSMTFLRADGISSGEKTVWSLVPESFKEGMWQLVIAGVVLAAWKGRRLGLPVEEERQVEIPASRLVVAAGDLLHRANQRDGAAAMLRHEMRLEISKLMGLAPTASPDLLAEAITTRIGIPRPLLIEILWDGPMSNDEQLIRLSQMIESIKKEISNAR